MIITKIEINGVEYTDYRRVKVDRSTDNYNSSSNFQVTFDSPFGRHKDDFAVGQEIIIYADETDASTKLFSGVVEKVNYKGNESTQEITLTGRDYSLRLQDATVEPSVYTNSEISEIVKDIIDNNVSDITYTNVDTTPTNLKRISFNHNSVFDALEELAKLAGYFFYVDEDADLHFEEKNLVSSGITLDNTNITEGSLNQTREGMANSIYVYGDRVLAGFEEKLNFDGGSVYTLLSKPRNTLVYSMGSPQKGGVFELTSIPESGVNYLVSYNDRQIVFTSGTDLGYSSIPTSGQSGLIIYDREIPIVKFGQNSASIALYGKKEKIIDDKSINDPNTAVAILKKELTNADPFRGVEVSINGWYSITPGSTARVTLDDFDIDEDIGILSASYDFNKNSVADNSVIRIKLDKKIKDITDEIKDLRKRLISIESAERQETDVITRLEQFDDNVFVVGSYWEVKESVVTGSQYHLYSTNFVPPVNPWHLASGTDQGHLAGSYTGSAQAFSDFETIKSGGFYN